jgi:hypothetical protein
MPQTPNFGFEYEVPLQLPGVTLTGGPDGTSPILAEQVDTVLTGIDARVSTTEGDIAALQSSTPSDTGWIALDVAAAAGFSVVDSTYRHWGPIVAIRVQIQRTGSDITAGSMGNVVGDPNLFTINTTDARPSQQLNVACQASITSGSVTMFTSGLVNVTDLHTNSSIRTDDLVRITQTYFGSSFN